MRPSKTHGTADQMLSAFRNKVDDLEAGNTLEASTDTIVGSYDEEDETANEFWTDYLPDLKASVERELRQLDTIDSWTWNESEHSLILTIVISGKVEEFNIPFEDIYQGVSTDVEYIMQAINHTVESCTKVIVPDEVISSHTSNIVSSDEIEELTPEGFYQYFDSSISPKLMEEAANILYRWYSIEGEEFMPEYTDILDMLDAADDTGEIHIVSMALGEEDEDEEYYMDDIKSNTNTDAQADKITLIEWLSEHDQAYSDACDAFGVADLYEVDYDNLYNWVCDHDRLYEDLCQYDPSFRDIESATSIKSSEWFRDDSGVFTEPGDAVSESELEAYWNDNYNSDPVLQEYDTYDMWLEDTISQMTPLADGFEDYINSSSDFDSWYDSLSDDDRGRVDDYADEEGYPTYDECSDEQLSQLQSVLSSSESNLPKLSDDDIRSLNEFLANILYECYDNDPYMSLDEVRDSLFDHCDILTEDWHDEPYSESLIAHANAQSNELKVICDQYADEHYDEYDFE